MHPPRWCLQVGQCLTHPAVKEEELQAECNKNLYEQAMLAMQRAQFYSGAERRASLQASLLPSAVASRACLTDLPPVQGSQHFEPSFSLHGLLACSSKTQGLDKLHLLVCCSCCPPAAASGCNQLSPVHTPQDIPALSLATSVTTSPFKCGAHS